MMDCLLDFHCFSGLTDGFSILERRLFEGVTLLRDLRSPFRIPSDQDGIAHSLSRTVQTLLGPLTLGGAVPR